MKFLDRINSRWTGEQLASWSSVLKTVYVLFPLIIYFVAGDVVDLVLWTVLEYALKGASEEVIKVLTSYSYSIRALIYAAGLVVSMVLIRRSAFSELSNLPEEDKPEKLSIPKVLILVGIALVSSIGLNLLFTAIGLSQVSASFNEVKNAQYSVNFIFGIFLYGIVSPIAEEIIFRGIMYNRLKRIFPSWLAIFLSALLFGIFHWNLVQGLYGFLMGLIIVICYERFKSFWAPLIIHVVANLGIYILTTLL